MSDLAEAPGIFDLMEAAVCNGAAVTAHNPLSVVTSPEQWAFSILFPLHENSARPWTAGERLIVRVETTVEKGRIGVSIATPDQSAFIAAEEQRGTADGRTMIEILLDPPGPGAWLVVRNTASGGQASAARIHGIRAYRASAFQIPRIVEVPAVIPEGRGGFDVFDSPEAQRINQARLRHLESLQLPLEGKSVLDVGCGVGHLSGYFVERGCKVTCVDARPENLTRLRALYPGWETHAAHIELDSLARIGHFDVVFCYNLCRTENPIAALRNMASCCKELLLLETVVTDSARPLCQLVEEPREIMNPAASVFGCRPSPAFVAMALSRMGFPFIYATRSQPDFPDFDFTWQDNLEWRRDDHLLRTVLIASRVRLDNPRVHVLLEAPEGAVVERTFLAPAATEQSEIWVDVGCHLGEKTFSLAEQDPGLRVYAFEPNLQVASRLMGRLPNYVVLPMAITETDGSAPFYLNRFDAASSLLPFVPEGLKQWIGGEELEVQATISVPTIRLDTFLNGAGIRKVSYLKIDAQGADLAVVRSAGERLRDIGRISLEVQTTAAPLYRNASRKDEALRFLAEAGFELAAREEQSFGQEENLTFVRQRSAGAPAPAR